jgi:AcrR family transcriptional regulator
MNESTSTRRRQSEERRVQLIDTALRVFAEKGVEGATVKDLSEAAGVAQGLLYHYFRSKEDLLRAALERHYFLPDQRRIASPDRDRPAREVLVEVGEGFAAMLRERRPLLQVMVREAPTNPAVAERVERARREGVRLISAYLESRVAAGELRPHDTQATARLLLYAVLMAHLTDSFDDGFLTSVVDIILHGAAARRRRPARGPRHQRGGGRTEGHHA